MSRLLGPVCWRFGDSWGRYGGWAITAIRIMDNRGQDARATDGWVIVGALPVPGMPVLLKVVYLLKETGFLAFSYIT